MGKSPFWRIASAILRIPHLLAFSLLDWAASKIGSFRPLTPASGVALIKVDAIGDFVLWLHSADLLRDRYSDKLITLVCNQAVKDIPSLLQIFDKVIYVDMAKFSLNPLYRFKKVREIKTLGASIAIQPTFSRTYLTGDSLIRATRAEKKIGSFGDYSNISPWQKCLSDRWYTQLVPASEEQMMELERNAEFLKGLGIKAEPKVAKLPILVNSIGHLKPKKDYFIIFPGASFRKKMWPVDRFAMVAKSIVKETGWSLVLCGTKSEVEISESIIKLSGIKAINIAGKTSLPEFVEIIRGAKLLIGNDTSAVHISAAVSTPSVCILGGGHFGRFMPYGEAVDGVKPIAVYARMNCFGCNWICIKNYEPNLCVPCIAAVSVEDVRSAAKKIIRKWDSQSERMKSTPFLGPI